jgi:hypothetical protein
MMLESTKTSSLESIKNLNLSASPLLPKLHAATAALDFDVQMGEEHR